MSLVTRHLSLPVLVLCVLFVLGWTAAPAMHQEKPAVEQSSEVAELPLAVLLDTLAKRADHFERALPDFVATETVTQEIYKKDGKPVDRVVTVSLLAGRQLRVKEGDHVQLSFKEIRQVQSINGKPVKSAELKLNGIQVGGVFSSILLAHFASRDQKDYYFGIESRIDSVRNRPAYLLNFLSRDDRNNQYYLFNEKSYESRQKGRAWIDIETLAPLRIEYNELHLPKGIKSIFYAVDYAPVQLGDETFMLPIAAHAEVEEGKEINRTRHEYSDYRKFSTDVKID